MLELENDNNIIFKHANAPNSKVIFTKLRLWVPKIIFNEDGLKAYLEDYLKPKKWIYLRRLVRVFHCCSACEMMKDYKKL